MRFEHWWNGIEDRVGAALIHQMTSKVTMEISRVSYCGSLESWPLNRGHFKRKGLSLNFSATLIWLFLLRGCRAGGCYIYFEWNLWWQKKKPFVWHQGFGNVDRLYTFATIEWEWREGRKHKPRILEFGDSSGLFSRVSRLMIQCSSMDWFHAESLGFKSVQHVPMCRHVSSCAIMYPCWIVISHHSWNSLRTARDARQWVWPMLKHSNGSWKWKPLQWARHRGGLAGGPLKKHKKISRYFYWNYLLKVIHL